MSIRGPSLPTTIPLLLEFLQCALELISAISRCSFKSLVRRSIKRYSVPVIRETVGGRANIASSLSWKVLYDSNSKNV
ncbi:hypothetical protein LZ31DRAFT_549150 [Colletotrichum somersetense]|nr:hypothetical protein LZ31DRAFT_549150 [Colletotrichum somersetense]